MRRGQGKNIERQHQTAFAYVTHDDYLRMTIIYACDVHIYERARSSMVRADGS